MHTSLAPASRQARVASDNVAPVVSTSSTIRMLRPINRWRRFGCTLIAPLRVENRASRPRPSSDRVRLGRINRSGHCAAPTSSASALANRADWLNRRRNIRVQCNGTGAINVSSCKSGSATRASHRAAGRITSWRSPCFSASTNLRPLLRYRSAARPRLHGRSTDRQLSQYSGVSDTSPGNGTPQRSQQRPEMNGVSRQQFPHRPKSLSTCTPQLVHRGG